MRFFIAALVLVLLSGCGKSVPVPPPPDSCANVGHSSDVAAPDCQRILNLIEAGKTRYADRIDSRGRTFDVLSIVRIFFVKPDGHHPDGRPYIQMGNETWAGYFNSDFNRMFIADPNAIPHEVEHVLDKHFYPTLLREQPGTPGAGAGAATAIYRWQIIGHGTPDDPMRTP